MFPFPLFIALIALLSVPALASSDGGKIGALAAVAVTSTDTVALVIQSGQCPKTCGSSVSSARINEENMLIDVLPSVDVANILVVHVVVQLHKPLPI